MDNFEDLELNDSWNVYFHAKNDKKKYADNTTFLYNIKTIKNIWEVFNFIPDPQTMFSAYNIPQKKIKRTNEIPNAISVFRNNSYPQWEHESNYTGYEWSLRKQKNIYDTNLLWINLVCTVLGENFENSEFINGVRIVDCSIDNKVIYRFEIWIAEKQHKDFFENKIKTFLELPQYSKLIYRDHSTLKETNK